MSDDNFDLADFQTDVIARSETTSVLVDFWAPWCGPCKMLGPSLESLAREAAGRWALVKINTDIHQELAAQSGIRGIPDVRLFHHGKVIAQFAGAMPEPQVRRWLEQNLPTSEREVMARARQHLHAGQAREAAAVLEPAHRANPRHDELTALTARALVFENPARAQALLAMLPSNHPWEEAALIVREFAHLILHADAPAGNGATASGLVERYRTASRALQHEKFEDALKQLIEILQEKPDFDEGHARAECLAIFKHLGLRHPLSDRFSRAYSMAVNV